MRRHLLTNIEIQKYYQSKSKFNGVYLRNNLAKIKDWVYALNPDEYESLGTYLIPLHANGNNKRAS